MPLISAVIITYNEERNIARCLASLRDVADEIVVLDSLSTDRTREICESHGAKFFEHPFDGHIQQKNRAITYATHRHILSLDADEALDDKLRESIVQAKRDFQYDGYYMNRLTNYCGHWVRHSGWYPDRKLRLFDSSKGQWSGINPHDRYELFNGDRNTGRLRGNILHYSYYTLADHYKQVEYFTDISSRAYYENGRKASAWNLLVNPVAKFVHHYLVTLGFLDGAAGFRIARISAYATWLKYKKLKDIYRHTSK